MSYIVKLNVAKSDDTVGVIAEYLASAILEESSKLRTVISDSLYVIADDEAAMAKLMKDAFYEETVVRVDGKVLVKADSQEVAEVIEGDEDEAEEVEFIAYEFEKATKKQLLDSLGA